MASVKIILKKNKTDSNGEMPLYIRITQNRKSNYLTTGVKLLPEQWDDEKQLVKKNKRNSKRFNALLAEKVSEARGSIADYDRKKQSPSARKIKEVLKGRPITNFFDYAYSNCEQRKGSLSYASYNTYKTYLKKFEKFAGRDTYFEDIDVSKLKKYIGYCSNTLNNNRTTINYSLKVIALFFKEAAREDIIDSQMYPFSKVRVKKEERKPKYLNDEQFKSFQNYSVENRGKAQLLKDMFVFSVFAGGLRFSDVIELRWQDYIENENRITKTIRKTQRLHSFKIGQKAIEILNKYNSKNSRKEDIIFPLADIDKLFFKDQEHRNKIVKRAMSISNCHLNKIGKELNLPFSLSFHVSRHTFATRALNNGMRIEHVSKLMDHSDIGVTQIYANIISSELDKAVDKFIN